MIMLHIVQCFFQMIFERINTVKNSVVKFLFPQIIPDMLHGVELRRIWRKPKQADIIRDHERSAFMPTSAIKHLDDPVIQVSGSHLVKKYLHALPVEMRQYQ
jgi:hypothetical protein